MNTGTLFRWLKFHGIEANVSDSGEAEKEIRKVVSLVGGNRLHDLWESVDSPKFMKKSLISDEQEDYRAFLDKVFDDESFFLIIDGVCFTDKEDPVVIRFDKEKLLTVLANFYLYLDEIYISDGRAGWFISINHHFELFLFGEPSERKCIALKERIEEAEKGDEEDAGEEV